MGRKLFQEILEFRRYGNCLGKLYEDYRNYLVEKTLNEITINQLASNFNKNIFNKQEIDSIDATINVMKKYSAVLQNLTYERKQMGEKKVIVPNTFTHLETRVGNYCNKETFRKEFAKMKFENKDDLSAEDLANLLLDEYLKNFDEKGWLILEKDDYKNIKDV